VFFAGDVTDRGSPLEGALVRRVVRTGKPFVFVPGNHDSDTLTRQLARDGAIVLTRAGRFDPDKPDAEGDPVVDVQGLKVAGYDDPFQRLSDNNFADRYEGTPDASERNLFATWLRELRGRVDIVMVHNPALLTEALDELDADPPDQPLTILTGHTHHAELTRRPGATVIDAGTVGAGGTGNLTDGSDIGIARLAYASEPSFTPLAVDMVSIDPDSGSATARRERLDEPATED